MGRGSVRERAAFELNGKQGLCVFLISERYVECFK